MSAKFAASYRSALRSSGRGPSNSTASQRTAILALAAAATLMPASLFAQTSGTWAVDVGTAGGNWSVPSFWVDGIVPDNGGTVTFTTLPSFTTGPINIIQDQANVTVSGITFDTQVTYLIRPPAGNTTNTLTLSGPATINTPIPAINTLSTTVFGHQLQIPVAGTAGLTKNGPGTVTLWKANTYSGGTNINGGILVARQFGDSVFGDSAGSVSLNDGTIRITTGAWTSARTINLAGNGTIEASTTGTTTFNGAVIGSGDLNKIGSRGLTLTANNSYGGATNVLAGSLALSGNGAIGSTSAVTSRDTIILDNSATNLADRVNDAAPLTLQGSALAFTGSGSAASAETFGVTTFSRGTTTITVNAGAGQSATLNMTGPTRDTGAAAFFRGTNLGAAGPADAAAIKFSSIVLGGGGGAAGTTNISIIPWAYGNTSASAAANAGTNSFVTYGTTGIRPLDIATEYAATIPAGVTTDNVRLTAPQTLASASTINSLILAPGATGIDGAGTLTIATGALLALNNGSAIDAPLDFGSAEAMILAPASITFNGTIGGSGGLTKQGAGVATFAADNSYTGTTTIGGGTAAFLSSVASGTPSAFGNSSSAVVLAPAGLGTGGTTARLVYAGANPASFGRDLLVTGRIALNNAATIPGMGLNTATTLDFDGDITLDESPLTFVGVAGSNLRINGDISGDGGPITDGQSASGSVITLSGNNTFTGGTEMSGSTWEVGSDTAFGSGLLRMTQLSGQPTIRAVGGPRIVPNDSVAFSFSANYWQIAGNNDITFTGSINLSGSYTHNINNTALTTYAGVVHTGAMTKAGTGTLVLSGDNIYAGVTTISSGVLRAAHPNALGTTGRNTVVADGAALELAAGALSAEPVSFIGAGVGGTGAIRSLAGATSLGEVTMQGSAAIGVDAGSLTVGDVIDAGMTATLTKLGPGTLRANRVQAGLLDVSEGSIAITPGRSNGKTSQTTALTIAAGASLDLGDNDLVIDYSGASPIDTVRTLIGSGRANGAWNGSGINSSIAAVNPGRALGYGEASVVLGAGGGTFSGVATDATAVLIRYTWGGDSNLDGKVDVGDLGNLATNWQQSALWTGGDFDYNGTVNVGDLGILATNWQKGVGALNGPSFAETMAALGLGGVSVPEPGMAGVLAAAATLVLRRRRKLQK